MNEVLVYSIIIVLAGIAGWLFKGLQDNRERTEQDRINADRAANANSDIKRDYQEAVTIIKRIREGDSEVEDGDDNSITHNITYTGDTGVEGK